MKILMIPCSMFSLITQTEYIKQNSLNNEENKIDLLNVMPEKTWKDRGSLLDDLNYRLVNNLNHLSALYKKYDLILISRTNYATDILKFIFSNKVDKNTSVIITDEGTFTLRDISEDIKFLKKNKIKNKAYFSIFDKQEKKGIKLIKNDLRFLKEKAIKNNHIFSLGKVVIIVGTGLLRKLPMEDVEDYFTNVIDEVINKFPNNTIIYSYHQITRGSIEELINNRYGNKIVCRRFGMPTELFITDENTEAIISTFSTVTSSTNVMFPKIKQYYPDKFDVSKLCKGEKANVYEGLMIAKDYQARFNNMKPLSDVIK